MSGGDNINTSSSSLTDNHSYSSSTNLKSNTPNLSNNAAASSSTYFTNDSSPRQFSDVQKNNLRPNLNRNKDQVYMATKNVVKAIITLSQVVGENRGNNYLELVKDIGFELRKLLQSVDHLSPLIPAEAYK